MDKSKQRFGGNWTDEKLGRVSKYLRAYATIMNKQDFRFASGHKKGAPTALKIANDILKK
jgi:hypothetical protein